MRAIGANADLGPGETDHLVAQRIDCHRHQRHAHLLTRRKQHVHFPGRRPLGDLPGKIDQDVGVLAHRADNHHHLVAFLLGANCLTGRCQDLLAIGQACAAKLLDDD